VRLFSLHVCDMCLLVVRSGVGMMGPMGRGGFGAVQGHFNPAFMQGGQTGVGQFGSEGPRKRYRMDESG
jgi:hypothetical protein